MNEKLCPKCERKILSKTAPRCAYCGVSLVEGVPDWVAPEQPKQPELNSEESILNEAFNQLALLRDKPSAVEVLVQLGSPRGTATTLVDRAFLQNQLGNRKRSLKVFALCAAGYTVLFVIIHFAQRIQIRVFWIVPILIFHSLWELWKCIYPSGYDQASVDEIPVS
jgi:hypothetical protein